MRFRICVWPNFSPRFDDDSSEDGGSLSDEGQTAEQGQAAAAAAAEGGGGDAGQAGALAQALAAAAHARAEAQRLSGLLAASVQRVGAAEYSEQGARAVVEEAHSILKSTAAVASPWAFGRAAQLTRGRGRPKAARTLSTPGLELDNAITTQELKSHAARGKPARICPGWAGAIEGRTLNHTGPPHELAAGLRRPRCTS